MPQRSVANRLRRGAFAILLTLLAWPATTSAAYIQQGHCEGVDTPFHNDGLTASISQLEEATRVNLTVLGLRSANQTDRLASFDGDLVATITMTSLWGQSSHDVLPQVSTNEQSPPNTVTPLQKYRLSYDIEHSRPLEDYLLDIRLRLKGNNTLLSCSRTVITPDIGRPLSAAAFWLPAVTLALLVAASIVSRAFQGGSSQDATVATTFARTLPLPYASKVSDCLAFLQLIFFSGALTLHFPGFVRPITSFCSWSTLMFPGGPITGESYYLGIRDGLYEVNGTFGGTPGLELISQITGAPATAWTWINVISLVCMLLASLMLIFHLGPSIPWTRQVFDSQTMRAIRGTETHGPKSTIYTVLRLFFSYFMTPVAAWTSYQLIYANILPPYHTVISVIVLLLIPMAFWWSLRQTPARQLGYFLVDLSGAYTESESRPREQDQLALAIFVFMYLRGCIIGGLQISGLLQLLGLSACEILELLITVLLRRANALKTAAGLLCVFRLVLWLVCVGFLPGVAGHLPRSILGITLLAMHLMVLVLAFILPSAFKLAAVAARYARNATPGDHMLELPAIPPNLNAFRRTLTTDSSTGASHVQRWLERVNPADRASMQSINSDSASTCRTLVELPSSRNRPQYDTVHAISDDLSRSISGANTRSAEPPNFSRPRSTASAIR